MKRWPFPAALIVFTAVAGCVLRTEHKIDAHIVVDIRHIEQQADEILDYVEGKSDTLPDLPGMNETEQTSWVRDAIDFMQPVQVAYAQEMKTESPLITRLVENMRERHESLKALKDRGIVGENNRGYPEIIDADRFENSEEKNEGQRLVAAETADRKALYREIARLNKENNFTVSAIERIYAQTRLERAESGDHFQLPPPGKDFDDFMASRVGTQLPKDAKPEDWVVIP